MISKIEFPATDGNYLPSSIPAIVCNNVGLYPLFDEEFRYVLRHTLTGKYFGEAATRNLALKGFHELSALHFWDFSAPNLIKQLVGKETLIKARSIVGKMWDSFPEDESKPIEEIVYGTILRRIRHGKHVSEELRKKAMKYYFETM